MPTATKKPGGKAQLRGPARTTETMQPGKLYVSFWNMCLNNLPVGEFTHRVIAPQDAKALIEEARGERKLLCVSHDDLFAPYHKHERKDHDDLRVVLSQHFGIYLEFADFTSEHERDGGVCYSVMPLDCVEVNGDNRLLVVTCAYTLETKRRGKPLSFKIDPTMVDFHLIEARKSRQGS